MINDTINFVLLSCVLCCGSHSGLWYNVMCGLFSYQLLKNE